MIFIISLTYPISRWPQATVFEKEGEPKTNHISRWPDAIVSEEYKTCTWHLFDDLMQSSSDNNVTNIFKLEKWLLIYVVQIQILGLLIQYYIYLWIPRRPQATVSEEYEPISDILFDDRMQPSSDKDVWNK